MFSIICYKDKKAFQNKKFESLDLHFNNIDNKNELIIFFDNKKKQLIDKKIFKNPYEEEKLNKGEVYKYDEFYYDYKEIFEAIDTIIIENKLKDLKFQPQLIIYNNKENEFIIYKIPNNKYITNQKILNIFQTNNVKYLSQDNTFIFLSENLADYSFINKNGSLFSFNNKISNLFGYFDVKLKVKIEFNIPNSIFICKNLGSLGINNSKKLNKILNKEKKFGFDEIKAAIEKYNNKQVKEKINIKDNGTKFILEKGKDTTNFLKLINGNFDIEFFNEKTIVNTI